MKDIAVVGTVGIPACYGGFESLVENLTKYKSKDIKYKVFCSKEAYSERFEEYNEAELIYLPLKANGPQSILYDILSLIYCWFIKPDTVLILGVSGCAFLPFFRFFSKSKIITNIDGLEWKRDKWGRGARRFLKWSEKLAVKYSDIIVTDNKAITDYVKSEYQVESSTIAYGGDHALREVDNCYEETGYALGLCRIEPENNVHIILEAFAQKDMKIKFIGNWNSSDFSIKLREKYSAFPNIELIDPIYNLDDLFQIRKNCKVYLHGHSAGGTNPSLVEMMHFGVPILAFDCSFNRYSTEEKASYFSDSSSLSLLLAEASVEDYVNNGTAMAEIAKRRYTWEEIVRMYEVLY